MPMNEPSYPGGRITIGTAGHIDHGKTELIKALTGIDTDRLREEKERGISIELGFAFLDTGEDTVISIIDVPGHERFIKHMVAGASGIDFAIMVVAADEGVMPQTREHLVICQMLGIKQGIVVITKKDLVDEELLNLNIELAKEQFAGSFLESAPFFTISARTGEGIDTLKNYLKKVVSSTVKQVDPATCFHMYVDRVFTMKGFGTVVTGTTLGQPIEEKSDIMIYPGKILSKTRNIQVHGKPVNVAYPGQRTAINLLNIPMNQVSRGDVIALPGSLEPTYLVDATFFYLPENKKTFKTRKRIRFHHGTSEIMGRMVILGKEELNPGENNYVQFRLEKPVTSMAGDHYIVRSYSPMRTIGGGIIIDPVPGKKKHSRKIDLATFKPLETRDPVQLLKWGLAKPRFDGWNHEQLDRFGRLYRINWKKWMDKLVKNNDVVVIELKNIKKYVLASMYQNLENSLLKHLEKYHNNNPTKLGMPLSGFQLFQDGKLNKDYLKVVLEHMVAKEKIEWVDDLVKLKGKKIVLSKLQEQVWESVETIFKELKYSPPIVSKLIEMVSYDKETVLEVLNAMVNTGCIIPLSDTIYYHNTHFNVIIHQIKKLLSEKNRISVADVKSLLGITRKYAIPILEHTDKIKLTKRDGDHRIPGELLTR